MILIYFAALLLTAGQVIAIDPKLLRRAGKRKFNLAAKDPYRPPTTTVECYDSVTTTSSLCVTETPVPPVDGCTFPLTYWKQNPSQISSLTLGSVSYPRQLIIDILHAPNNLGQNSLISLAKQLAVAKLNYYKGHGCKTTLDDLKAADDLIGNKFVSLQSDGYLDISFSCNVLKRLEACNRGILL